MTIAYKVFTLHVSCTVICTVISLKEVHCCALAIAGTEGPELCCGSQQAVGPSADPSLPHSGDQSKGWTDAENKNWH